MNHVAVDRCYQCGTSFAVDDRALETVEVGAATVASASVRGARTPAPGAVRVQPSLAPLEPTPIAFSDRMEAGTERVAMPAAEAQPLKPFAEAAPADGDDDVDWMDPRHAHAARQGMRVQRRNRMVHAMLAIVVLCVVAAGAYYAYDSGALPRVADMARAFELTDGRSASAAPAAARPGEGVAGSDASMRPATPEPDAPAATATVSPAASATPPATNPSTASTPVTTGTPTPAANPSTASTPVTTDTPTAAANPSTPATAALATETPVQSTSELSVPVARTHGATPRRTLRNPSTKPPRSANAQTTSNKDAVATQRLIERDLAGFLGADASHGAGPR